MRTAAVGIVAVALVATPARAQEPQEHPAPCPPAAAGCYTEAVGWTASSDGLFMGAEVDTGWVPGGSPLQLRIIIDMVAEAGVDLSGTVGVWWPMPLTTGVGPDPLGGLFTTNYRFFIEVGFRLEDTVFDTGTIFEASLPVFDRQDSAMATFESFAFTDEALAMTEAELGPERLVEYNLLNLFGALGVSVPGFILDIIQGNVFVDVSAPMAATYSTTRIVVDDGAGSLASLSDAVMLGPADGGLEFGPSRDILYQPEGVVDVTTFVEITPGVEVVLAGETVASWSVPIPFEVNSMTAPAVFEPRLVHVPLPDISTSPRTLDFTAVAVGDSGEVALTVENRGEARLELTVDPLESPFRASNNVLSVEPGATATLNVEYFPQVLDEDRATLFLHTNDPDQPLVRVPIMGQGAMGTDAGVGGAPGGDEAGGCGCRTVAPASDGAGPALLLAGLLGLVLVRRRRR